MDIILDNGIAKEVPMRFSEKKKLIKKIHIRKNGDAITIKQVHDSKGVKVWKTRIKGKDFTCRSEEGLYDKLIEYYTDILTSNTKNQYLFKTVWYEAYNAYLRKHPKQKKTTESHMHNYKRFVSDSLAQMDMREITSDFLEDYAIDYATNNNLILSAYNAMKGVFNLAFNYALKNRKIYPDIVNNPTIYMDNTVVYPLCIDTHAEKTTDDIMHTPEEIEAIIQEANRRSEMTQFHGYYIYKYLIEAHYELGCRPGELVSLRWSDIYTTPDGHFRYFRIHASQRDNRDGTYSYLVFTKNEKNCSKGGREFPITNALEKVLKELSATQQSLGIESEYIFCNRNGNWIPVKDYLKALKSICDKLCIKSKGSYAFRHDVNDALEASRMSDASKGKAMGNNSSTNRHHYCHAEREYTRLTREALEARNRNRKGSDESSHTAYTSNVIVFPNRKSPQTFNS